MAAPTALADAGRPNDPPASWASIDLHCAISDSHEYLAPYTQLKLCGPAFECRADLNIGSLPFRPNTLRPTGSRVELRPCHSDREAVATLFEVGQVPGPIRFQVRPYGFLIIVIIYEPGLTTLGKTVTCPKKSILVASTQQIKVKWLPGQDQVASIERMRLMSKSVVGPAVNPLLLANWGPMLLGIVCLGIGFWFAIGTLINLDFMLANHNDSWPLRVIVEVGIAVTFMVFGSWFLLQGVRSSRRQGNQ